MSFYKSLKTVYPSSVPLKDYLKTLSVVLGNAGFERDNTILCLSTCRDENTRPLHAGLVNYWGPVFNLSGLGGLLFCGRASLKAAINHAPVDEFGVERYLFIGMTHIGISEDGEVGRFVRPNRPGKSGACGALDAIREEIVRGNLPLEINQLDIEMSLLRQKIVSHMEFGKIPTLVDITEIARRIIQEDLERLTDQTVESKEYGTCMMNSCKYYEASDLTGTCLMLKTKDDEDNESNGYTDDAELRKNGSSESVLEKDENAEFQVRKEKRGDDDYLQGLEFGTCMMLGCKVGIDLKYQKVQYAYQSGIQVHGPENETWIVPGGLYINTDLEEGKKRIDVKYMQFENL